MAKTKVAPIKTQSIPRIELCAAALLAKLILYLVDSLLLFTAAIYCWTDSEIVLRWLQKQPSSWPVFVAHSVSKIQTSLSNAEWGHVRSKDNPADYASRGIDVPALLDNSLWWQGPKWLLANSDSWPKYKPKSSEKTLVHVVTERTWCSKLLERVSSWASLLRITAYVLRFVQIIKTKKQFKESLSAAEINHASNFWVLYAQQQAFFSELNCLQHKLEIPSTSQLLKLNPFVDKSGILRLGGRLKHSTLPKCTKFPVILPKHRISQMIITQLHVSLLHAGTQLTLGVLREKFWILGARNLVKAQIYNCVTCTREKGKTVQQFMSDLPLSRCSPSRPFSHTGLDYAGPFSIRASSGRGNRSHKAYVAVFVCFAVKAVHLELVHDYSTPAFLVAYKRFVSRRGLPSDLYSDNGTNFRGAERELRNALRAITQDSNLKNYFASDGTSWHFLSPLSPHFGGLWEAGVKSAKMHLKRVLGSRTPTIKEFATLLCQIECCLNSRPLAPLSDDPNCLQVLTPGHFLVGSALKIVPEQSVLEVADNRLSRWQTLRKILESFWRSWRRDYIHSLQLRYKRQKRQPNLKIGDIVLLKNSNLPPAKWELGRIIECTLGNDNLVRLVKVKTANSEFVRPIHKIVKLPVNQYI